MKASGQFVSLRMEEGRPIAREGEGNMFPLNILDVSGFGEEKHNSTPNLNPQHLKALAEKVRIPRKNYTKRHL